MHFPQNTCDICTQRHQQQQQRQNKQNILKLRKNIKSEYQLQDLALNCCGSGNVRSLNSPPVYDAEDDTQHSKQSISATISPQHFRSFSQPQQPQSTPQMPTPTSAPYFRHHNSSPIIDGGLHKSASSIFNNWSRRNSSYHSCDDLDGVGGYRDYHNSTEHRVVASIKYICACTGATLRSLTKKTKDLHANYSYQKPTWRYWGDEPEDNAIFTVYLKKVRYHRPTPTANNDSDDEISHLEWETVRVRFVKAATLERLVEALATDDGELESTFINVFLSTYRTFSTPKEVLNLLIRRYDTLNKHLLEIREHHLNGDTSYDASASIHEQHKKTLVSALRVWLDGFPEDWNEENLSQLRNFAAKRLPRSELFLKVQHRLELLLRQNIFNGNRLDRMLRQQPPQHYSDTGLWMNSGGGVGITELPTHYNSELAEKFNGLCLAAIQHGHPHILQAFRFPHVPVRHFAEQLTRLDSELFKRLIPHQCLGATWARRDKGGAETVVATINQFNKVLFRVISSILVDPSLKPQYSVQERALNIDTWIDIAQELRLLKNFSSLKAIISGLQSNSIHRLTKTWALLSKDKMEIFVELSRIFSADNNAWAQREVLKREGTAKFADTAGTNDRHLINILKKQSTLTSHGTIPFLGTFLTDLQMIHNANPDTIAGLVNFDKKRKEFEMLAQIKLLQGAANTYNLRDDNNFDRWFASMFVLDDEQQAHMLACQLESSPTATRKSNASSSTNTSLNASMTTTNGTSNKSMATLAFGGCVGIGNSSGVGHRKTDSIVSNSSSGNGSQLNWDFNKSSSYGSRYSSRHNSLDRDAQLQQNMSLISTSSSTSNLSMDSSHSGGQKTNPNHSKLPHSQSANGSVNTSTTTNTSSNGTPLINAQLVQTADGGDPKAPNFYIIRVTYETDNVELDGIVLYKSIMLGNNERTPQVIRNAMLKLGLEADPERYTLAQVLPDREFVFRKDANVFYAVNTNYNLNFILRPKKDGAIES